MTGTGTVTVRVWLADEMKEVRVERTFSHGDSASTIVQTLLRDSMIAAMGPDQAEALKTLGLPRSLNPWLTVRPDHVTFDAGSDEYLATETCWARLDRDGIAFGQPAPDAWLTAKRLDRTR